MAVPTAITLLAALTGYGQESDIQRAHQSGFDVHLVKPLDLEQLSKFIATAASRQNRSEA